MSPLRADVWKMIDSRSSSLAWYKSLGVPVDGISRPRSFVKEVICAAVAAADEETNQEKENTILAYR